MTVKISQDSLDRALSPERFAPYLTEAAGDIDLAWATYRWNLDLVSLIMPLISDVEVTLRNTIHTQLTDHFATAQWWTSPRL